MTGAARTSTSEAWTRWEKPAYGLLLAWFAARVVYLAFALHPYVPPDEATHFGRVVAYTKTWGVPANGPGTYELGLLDHRPWLYYWVVARAMALNVVGMHPLVFARLVNGVLGVATVGFAIAWARAWMTTPWARVLFVVLLSNTLMFTGLAASVSYDNGANLLAAVALWAFARFRREPSPGWLLALLGALCAGALTKRTFLPLGAGFALLLAAREWRALPGLAGRTGAALRAGAPRVLAGTAAAVLLASLALALYGGNLVRYGKLRPAFDQVVGEEAAMRNRVHARATIVDAYREGRIDLAEARARAETIRHAGDRSDTLFLLQRARVPESSLIGPLRYVPAWGHEMLSSAIGYLGHRRAMKGDTLQRAYLSVLVLATLFLVFLRWPPGAANGVAADAALLAVGYAMVLMWLVNYPTYQTYRYVGLALQGRYLFPVLLPICALVAWALGELAPERLRPWLCAIVAGLFLYGDLPWLLQQMDERWFMPA